MHRGKGFAGDDSSLEEASDEDAESVGIEVPDVGGGLDDAASDKASPLLHQLGGGEGVGEEVVVQTRDATETINRDGTGFIAGVSPGQAQNESGHLLSFRGLTPAVTRAEHLVDGVDSDQGKALCEGAGGELPDGILHSLDPNLAFLYYNADVGVLVEYLVDRDEKPISFFVTVRCKRSVWYGVSWQRRCVPNLVVK